MEFYRTVSRAKSISSLLDISLLASVHTASEHNSRTACEQHKNLANTLIFVASVTLTLNALISGSISYSDPRKNRIDFLAASSFSFAM